MDKPRKNVKAEINKEVKKDGSSPVDIAMKLKVDERPSIYTEEGNRYQKSLELKKKEKMERDAEKLKKPHIGDKRRMENVWVAQGKEELDEQDQEIREEIAAEKKKALEGKDDSDLLAKEKEEADRLAKEAIEKAKSEKKVEKVEKKVEKKEAKVAKKDDKKADEKAAKKAKADAEKKEKADKKAKEKAEKDTKKKAK